MLKRLLRPLVLLLFMTGCTAKEYDWVIKIEDQPIAPQDFVVAQMHAYVEAQPLADNGADVLKSTIDGVDGNRWINSHTLEKLKRDYFIETEFEKRNLKFASQARDFIEMFGREGWENVQSIYTNNGLELQHYLDYLETLYMEQLVFNDIFINSSEAPVTDREIEDYLHNNLCRVSLFKVARVNDNGSPLEPQQITAVETVVTTAVDSINNGLPMADAASVALTDAGKLLGSNEDFSNGADFVSTAYISNSNINLVYDFMADFFTVPQGQCVYYTLDDCYYICQRIPLCDTQVEYMYLKQDVVNILRDVEFEEMIAAACRDMTVEYNDEALKNYSPAKINMTIG